MNIAAFLSAHQDTVQVIFYSLVLTSFWIIEILLLKSNIKDKLSHSGTNFLFICTALPVQLLVTSAVVFTSVHVTIAHWGLIEQVPLHHNKWFYYIALFVLLDLGEYCYHVLMHKFDIFWRFHLVHHSDVKVDVSTTVREHPVETAVRTLFLVLWVFLLGANFTVLVIRQSFQTVFNIFSHAEFRLPEPVNRVLAILFITPNLHHVHHHYELPYTDKNYGDVLSIWDRLFGTYTELKAEDTVFGIDTHMSKELNGTYISALKMPFAKIVREDNSATSTTNSLSGACSANTPA